LAYVALLAVLASHIEGREWLLAQKPIQTHEQSSKAHQQQQKQQQQQLEQVSVFWQRRVQQLDPGFLSRAESNSDPALLSPVPAAGGSGEPEDMSMCCMQLALLPRGHLSGPLASNRETKSGFAPSIQTWRIPVVVAGAW
jgi:hypothetical protein